MAAKKVVAKRSPKPAATKPSVSAPSIEVPGADHPRPEARPDYRPPAAHDAKGAP